MPENKCLVGIQGEQIIMGLPIRAARMSKDEALTLAAFLVAVSTTNPEKDFEPILKAVMNT